MDLSPPLKPKPWFCKQNVLHHREYSLRLPRTFASTPRFTPLCRVSRTLNRKRAARAAPLWAASRERGALAEGMRDNQLQPASSRRDRSDGRDSYPLIKVEEFDARSLSTSDHVLGLNRSFICASWSRTSATTRASTAVQSVYLFHTAYHSARFARFPMQTREHRSRPTA